MSARVIPRGALRAAAILSNGHRGLDRPTTANKPRKPNPIIRPRLASEITGQIIAASSGVVVARICRRPVYRASHGRYSYKLDNDRRCRRQGRYKAK